MEKFSNVEMVCTFFYKTEGTNDRYSVIRNNQNLYKLLSLKNRLLLSPGFKQIVHHVNTEFSLYYESNNNNINRTVPKK